MEATDTGNHKYLAKLTLAAMPTPIKVLATCIIATLAFGMAGALGQIVVHDIIPTFGSGSGGMSEAEEKEATSKGDVAMPSPPDAKEARGDLFEDLSPEKGAAPIPFYRDEQFVWTLKWTHIHLFGINMIFIFTGLITAFLDAGTKLRAWLVALPFIGVLIDVAAMWLKAFVSPLFFWLHIPGGGIFTFIFGYVSLRALWEMWIKPDAAGR